MLKKLIIEYIRKNKNTEFSLDENVSSGVLLSFSFTKLKQYIRGQRMLLVRGKLQRIFIGKSVILFNKNQIFIGRNSVIGNYVKLYALCKDGLKLGDNVTIGDFTHILVSSSFNNIGEHIFIGDNVAIGEFSYLGGAGGLEIGADTIIGQYFSTHPENHVFSDGSKLIRKQGVSREGIKVGRNCWLGSKVTVLDGAEIGNNCVVAAGAVIRGRFDDNVLIAGVPGRVIRSLK